MSEREPPVPKLPRGKGMSLTGPAIFRILVFGSLLVAVIVLQGPCAESIGRFFGSFDPPPADAGVEEQTPDPYADDYVRIGSDASEAEIREIFEQEKQKAEQREKSAPQ